jgi:phosphatidylinositol alpha-1,6-mannosyltransferase
MFGLRVSVMTNGLDVFYARAWYQAMVRRCLPFADIVVCPSERLVRDALARGARSEAIRRIPYGIWPEECVLPAAKPFGDMHLLTIGRLIPRKGVAWFLEHVFPAVLEKYPHVQYSIIGSGPDERRVRALIAEHGWERCVRLRPQAEREVAFVEATQFVMPNIPVEGNGEGLPIVCLEAPARGIPVAAARLEGIEDAVEEGVTGTFFTAGDAVSCIESIERLHASPLDAQAMRDYVLARHAWPMLLRRYEAEVFSLPVS